VRVRHWLVLVATSPWLLPASRAERRGVTQPGVTVTVVIDGAAIARGQIGVALFASDAGFPEQQEQAARRQLHPWRAPMDSVVFRDVPPGRYAVAVHHDLDADGTLKKSMLGVPQEPWGVSRDVRHRMRAPRFEEAVVDVRGDMRIAVRVAK
jgi:uncharacterized protein (DUF2141 family)